MGKEEVSQWDGEIKRRAQHARGMESVPRYSKETEDYILRHYREGHGWHKGARITRVRRPREVQQQVATESCRRLAPCVNKGAYLYCASSIEGVH